MAIDDTLQCDSPGVWVVVATAVCADGAAPEAGALDAMLEWANVLPFRRSQSVHRRQGSRRVNRRARSASGRASGSTCAAPFCGRRNERTELTTSKVTIDGVAYHALRSSATFIVLLNDTYFYSGGVNILHVFNWLSSQGWVKLSDSFSMIGYGVEISVTETSPGVQGQDRFDFIEWSLNAN
jgi:hypothetical protein